MRSLTQIKNLKNKTALVRVDFNVPIKDGEILDDFRIKKALLTINFLIKKGAKIILMTHLGKNGKASLLPIIERFFKISKIDHSKVKFFENIRKFPGEIKNDSKFAKILAGLGDIYVNEAFSVSHREHASITLLPKLLPSYAGFQFEEEIKNLSKVFKNSKHPFLFIAGGAKFETKMPLIKKYIKLADHVFIGGSLLNDFLKAKGYEVGKSLISGSNYGIENILKNPKLILPCDVTVKSEGKLINKKINEVKKDEFILDIGKESVKILESYIKKSKIILWNGPLGRYEDGGGESTESVLKLVAKTKTESIIGGGDIVYLISKLKLEKKFSFVSTGGGATLQFLADGTLPGIKALK